MIIKQEKLYITSDEPRIPDEYREYTDIFIVLANKVLPKYRPFDYKINIKEGTKPTFIPIYQLL
jgi:hypothetical protein